MTRNSFAFVQTVLLFLFLINSGEFFSTKKSGCTTPDGKSGKCIPLRRCQSLKNFVDDSKPATPNVTRRLKEYSCSRGDSSKICCVYESVLTADKIPDPPDVTKHKNVHLLPEDCGYIDINDKIRNGENAGFNEFPWMTLLSYDTPSGPSFQCGGTIINDRYILTAAHCVVNVSFPLKGVRVGEYNLATKIDCLDSETCNPAFQDLAIEKVIYPTDYNLTLFANDIALIRVSKINLEAENAVPVCLPVHEAIRKNEFTKGVVTGWGFTDPRDSTTDILQKVTLEKRDLSVCSNAYSVEPSIVLNHKQLCIGGIAQKDSCRGDSGGPFHVATYFNDEDRYVQYGVVSIGPLYCGYEGVPGIYARVTYYLDWILDHLEK